MPIDTKIEDEVIRVPVRSPTEAQVKAAPADETAVWARPPRRAALTL